MICLGASSFDSVHLAVLWITHFLLSKLWNCGINPQRFKLAGGEPPQFTQVATSLHGFWQRLVICDGPHFIHLGDRWQLPWLWQNVWHVWLWGMVILVFWDSTLMRLCPSLVRLKIFLFWALFLDIWTNFSGMSILALSIFLGILEIATTSKLMSERFSSASWVLFIWGKPQRISLNIMYSGSLNVGYSSLPSSSIWVVARWYSDFARYTWLPSRLVTQCLILICSWWTRSFDNIRTFFSQLAMSRPFEPCRI